MHEKLTNRITITDLAHMVNVGFEDTARKTDLDRLETNLAAMLVKTDDRLERMEVTLHLIATAVADSRDLHRRMERLEAKIR
jgi:hypothetical protein